MRISADDKKRKQMEVYFGTNGNNKITVLLKNRKVFI